MRSPIRLALAAIAAVGAVASAFAPPALAGSSPEEPPVPVILDPTPPELETINAALARIGEKEDPEEADRLLVSCLLEMEKLRHESWVPVIRGALKSKNKEVLPHAIRAAATHELKDEAKNIRKLLSTKGGKKKQEPQSVAVVAAAIDYCARLDVKGEEAEVLEHLTEVFLDERRMKGSAAEELVRASIHYLGVHKHRPAAKKLVEMLEEPVPADPNSGTNPPESYWKARYEIWLKSEGWVRWALKEITGQEYRTFREWKAWWDRFGKDYEK